MLAQDFVTEIRGSLFDPPPGAGWSDSELLGYLNQALRTTSTLKPDAYTRRVYIPLVAGTNQALPADGLMLLDLDNNEVSQRSITLVQRGLLDHQNRFWQASTQEKDVQHWAADSRDPRRFDVTPPNDGTGSVRALYGAIPAALALTDVIPLADSYHYALRCFVLSLAWAKPSKRLNATLAASNMQEYRAALVGATQMQAAMAPSAGREAGN